MTRAALAALLLLVACHHRPAERPVDANGFLTATVPIAGPHGTHSFSIELVETADQQEKGLTFRATIPDDSGMLFWPYPPDVDGKPQPPRAAIFWMKNTPSALDIVFIRPDGMIARIAENAPPLSQAMISSGEPVAAVLELRGGRTSELGIAEGDRVTLPRR